MGYKLHISPVPPLPPNPTQEDRERMLAEYKAELMFWNPWAFHADGTPKRWWETFLGIFRSRS